MPAVRDTFGGFRFEEVRLSYSVGQGMTPAREVFVGCQMK